MARWTLTTLRTEPPIRASLLAASFLAHACHLGQGEPTTSHGDDIGAYATALGAKDADPHERMRTCRSITTPALAGDCALVAAREAENREPGSMEALCPLVPEGTWRYECWFELVEATRQRDPARAVASCERAGPFVEDCRQHLWQSVLFQAACARGGFAESLPEARRLHKRWSRLLGHDPAFDDRFWRQFYRAVLTGGAQLGTDHCASLEPADRDRCREADRSLEAETSHASLETEQR